MINKRKFLLLLAGSPGTGKTYFIKMLADKYRDMYVVTPDEAKIYYAEKIGFNNLEERQMLERNKVWPFFYKALDLYMEAGKKVVVSEYPFSDKQKGILSKLAKKYNYEVITIRLIADFEILWKRRYLRDRNEDRHLSFIMNNYHYGDTCDNLNRATNQITKEEFRQIIQDRQYEKFQLGELIEINVNDYDKVDYSSVIDDLVNRFEQDNLKKST